MKKMLLETKFSKIYMLVIIILTLLIVGGYFSYAIFTVSKEKNNAISIVTGNLTYDLKIDGASSNTLSVNSGETKEFTVTLSNPNSRIARFNFYYIGALPDGVSAGYVTGDGFSTPPLATGVNLEANGSVGASNVYKIRVTNNSGSNAIVTLGVQVGLNYNDLSLPNNGHLFEEYNGFSAGEIVKHLISGNTYDDGVDTFITGTDPNNYIWYSGKLWRAVYVNNSTKTVKLVTQWNISAIPYSDGNSSFKDSYIEKWLNDTSVDGFLGNLREPERFIVMDAKWNATETEEITKPAEITMVEDAVGLLNYYEYITSYRGTTASEGYLNNELYWWTLTPYSSSNVRFISNYGIAVSDDDPTGAGGVRPSINLKASVKIISGNGTVDNPYRLNGDDDTNLSGTLLNTRYSGEYIRFGVGENNLYRIVSHENGTGTKITSAEPLKKGVTFIESAFGSNTTFSSTNTIGTFLNNDYLNPVNGYLTNEDIAMIEDSTTWYLGIVGSGSSYKLAKYTDTTGTTLTSSATTSKVGLLRIGELMAGQFDRYGNNINFWLLTPFDTLIVRFGDYYGGAGNGNEPTFIYGIRPCLNLKSNVVITEGDGTLQNPYILTLDS